MNVGGGRSSGEMPQEIVDILTSAWGEMGDLRQSLIGQFMGILSGEGPYEYVQTAGAPGHYEERQVPYYEEGRVEPLYRTEQVWVPGEEAQYEWQQTGGAGAQIPLIAQAQAAQRRATSRAMRETETGLARQGLAGTPFAENIMAQQRQTGAQAFAAIEPGIIGQFLQMIPGYTQGAAQSIIGALPGTRETETKEGRFGFGAG